MAICMWTGSISGPHNIWASLCSYSLSGIIHVMYAALNQHLSADSPDDETEECGVRPSSTITEDEANMAVILTEYFQKQRKVYEKVH